MVKEKNDFFLYTNQKNKA